MKPEIFEDAKKTFLKIREVQDAIINTSAARGISGLDRVNTINNLQKELYELNSTYKNLLGQLANKQ